MKKTKHNQNHTMLVKKFRNFVCLVAVFSLLDCNKKQESLTSKVLNVSMPADTKGFDPLLSADLYTHTSVVPIYEGLLEYEYLKRPYELRPLLAKEMPEISADGLTYRFKLRDQVFFHADKAFSGPRKLTSKDVAYTLKRFADPASKNPSWWILGEKIEGLEQLRKDLTGKKIKDLFNAEISGIKLPDDLTIEIKLTAPDRQFLYSLAMAASMVVAHEVVETYGDEFLNHPVGTGPFMLKNWKRNQRIELIKNPNYWGSTYPTEGEGLDQSKGLLSAAGQRLPFLDGVNIHIFVESQPQWLNFLKGKLDITGIPKDAYDAAFTKEGTLKPEYAKKNLLVNKTIGADLIFQVFNMDDPVLGKNIFLRKAISSAINRESMISRFYNGRAVIAHGMIPPDISGHNDTLKDPNGYNPKLAREWLQKAKEFHQKQTGEKELPVIEEDISESADSRQMAEAFALDLAQVGIKTKLVANTWTQFSEKLHKRQTQFAGYGWSADYPDAENFLQLLFGKNVSPSPNAANYVNPAFDALYTQMKNLPDGEERNRLISKMTEIAQADCPWVLLAHRINMNLQHPWLKNYKANPIMPGLYKYYDLDLKAKEAGLKHLN